MYVPTPAQRLADAEDALHRLQIGDLAVEVEHDGRRVRYTRPTLEALRAYVDQLRAEAAGQRPRFGGIGVHFN